MRILGLFSVIVMIIIGYYVYNPVVVDSAGVTNAEKEKSSSDDCKGPFGVDSQKILNTNSSTEYVIGSVYDIELGKDGDGPSYIDSCRVSGVRDIKLFFTAPYPQQSDLKEGDLFGFTAKIKSMHVKLEKVHFFLDGKILENISSQSVDCKIDNIKGLSTPAETIPKLLPGEEDFVNVTGVIMAVEIHENKNPGPDNPYNYLITSAVMKCADGNLYITDFLGFMGTPLLPDIDVNLPNHDAFGEGDVVTVTQATSITYPSRFAAYYRPKNEQNGSQ